QNSSWELGVGDWKLLFLLRRRAARSGSTKEQTRAIREYEVPADRLQSAVLRTIAFDRQFRTDRHGVLRHTHANQLIRTAALDQPLGHLAIRFLHRHVEPGMRIDHLP